eukprot:2067965-Rhodomonas_salina.1
MLRGWGGCVASGSRTCPSPALLSLLSSHVCVCEGTERARGGGVGDEGGDREGAGGDGAQQPPGPLLRRAHRPDCPRQDGHVSPEPRRAEQSGAEESRGEQSRAEQSRAEQSRAEERRGKNGRRAERRRGEERSGEQSRAEQSRAEQSWTRAAVRRAVRRAVRLL